MDGRIQGDGTAGIVPYIVSVNSKNQITALANTNVTYQQLNVLAAGAGGGTRYLSANNAGVLSWQTVASGGIGGGGTLNTVAKFTPDGVTVGNSDLIDTTTAGNWQKAIDGANIGISASSTDLTRSASVYVYEDDGLGNSLFNIVAQKTGVYQHIVRGNFGLLEIGYIDISAGVVPKSILKFTTDDILALSPNVTVETYAYFADDGAGGIALRSGVTPGGGTTTNALTIGTGLTGGSFDGSAPITINIDSTVVTLTGSQALTNKTYNGNTWTAGSNTLTLAGNFITTGAFNTTFAQQATATITLPSATSTLLANNLGITGGSTWISGTAVGDKAIIQATSNATHTAAKDLITLRKNSSAAAATSVLMTIGDGQGLNNDEVSIYTGVNTGTSGYLLRAGATFAYFNASSSLRLQIAAADIIQLSSSTATFVQGLTISDAKNIVLNTTTGTKIGTATSQKLGFWNKTPIVQPTTSISVTASFVANTSANFIYRESTIGGYTFEQIAQALINLGALA